MGFFKPPKITGSDHYSTRVVINAKILTIIIQLMGVYGLSHMPVPDGMPHYAWLLSVLISSVVLAVMFYPLALEMSCFVIGLGNELFKLVIVVMVVAREKILDYIYRIDD